MKQSLSELIDRHTTLIENDLVYLSVVSDSLNKEELENLYSEITLNIDIVLKTIEISDRQKYQPETQQLYIVRKNSQVKQSKLGWITKISNN